MKAIKGINDRKLGPSSQLITGSLSIGFRAPLRDFYDIKVPRRTGDFPRSTLRLLALEKQNPKGRSKAVKEYTPITHVLEKTKDRDSKRQQTNPHFDISSLSS